MHLRPFQGEDWDAVCEIYDLSKPDEMRDVVDPQSLLPLVNDEAMTRLFRVSQIVVAEEAARVVGFAGHRGSFITWLFVHPQFRRRGIAKALVHDLIARLEHHYSQRRIGERRGVRVVCAARFQSRARASRQLSGLVVQCL